MTVAGVVSRILLSKTTLGLGLCLSLFAAHEPQAAHAGMPVGMAPGQTQAPAAIDIPEGTPVVFHVYGDEFRFKASNGSSKADEFYTVIQVDQDTVVDHVVVVPRGSLGEIKVGKPIRGRFRSQYFAGAGTVGFQFVPQYVLSAASTELKFTDEPLSIDIKHNNAEITQYGVQLKSDATFTAHLQHVSLVMPQ